MCFKYLILIVFCRNMYQQNVFLSTIDILLSTFDAWKIYWVLKEFCTLLCRSGWLGEERKQKNFIVGTTNCCWHFSRVTQTDREYGLMSSSKIGLVKITCHESLHSSHDVEFLHSYQQSYTSTWDKLWSPQCIIWTNRNEVIHSFTR